MRQQQVLWQIADSLYRKTPVEDIIGEVALLTAFSHLPSTYPVAAQRLAEQVVQGKLSLEDAYDQMAEALPVFAELFERSQLRNELPNSEVIEHLKVILSLKNDPGIWLKELADFPLHRKYMGTFLMPEELTQLMVGLGLSSSQAESVYAPFPFSSRLASEVSSLAKEVVHETPYVSNFAAACSLLQGKTLQESDPIRTPSNTSGNQLRKFSHVITAPPFGQKQGAVIDPYNRFQSESGQGDVMALEHGLAQCSGRMVAIVPAGLLFRSGADGYFREHLVSSGILDAVIQLPGAIFPNTAVVTCILVFDIKRNPDESVLFYNADDEELIRSEGRPLRRVIHGWQKIVDDVLNRRATNHSVLASKADIEQQAYDLSVSRYVLSEATRKIRTLSEVKRLSDIAQIIRAQSLKEDKEPRGEAYLEVGARDISISGVIRTPSKRMLLSGRAKDRAEQQCLQPGDILLANKGNLGKVGIVDSDCGENWVANQLFQVIRLNSDSVCRPEYLFRYLSSPLVQTYLQDQASGTTMPVLKTADINALSIPVPPLKEQEGVLETHQQIQQGYDEIARIQENINKLSCLHWNLSTEQQ